MEEEVLELASKTADQAEVYAITSETTLVSFEANRLKSLQTRETRGLALRLIKDGRLGFASVTRLDSPRALVESALEVAPFGAEARFEFPAEDAASKVQIYDPALADLTVEYLPMPSIYFYSIRPRTTTCPTAIAVRRIGCRSICRPTADC